MLNWYIFTATKDGETMHERIPADTRAEAEAELIKMGYSNIEWET